MTVTYTSPIFPKNHVSHSFDQYVVFDGDTPVYLDHGDAYPRTVCLQKGRLERAESSSRLPRAVMFGIPGETGANMTGVTLGGLVISDRNYIAAISTVDHSRVSRYTNFDMVGLGLDQRDIVMCVVQKNYRNGEEATRITIGSYIGTDKIASTPRIISNGDNTFTVLWQEFSLDGVPGLYITQLIDGGGQPIGQRRIYRDVQDYYRDFFGFNVTPGEAAVIDATASEWAPDLLKKAFAKNYIPVEIRGNYSYIITRAEFCRMAIRWLEVKTGKYIDAILTERGLVINYDAFQDTSDPDVLAAYALGLISGTVAPDGSTPGTFSPGGIISREQAAALIRNICRVAGMDVSNVAPVGYEDIDTASDWAVDGIHFCYAQGIMTGTNTDPLLFSPTAMYTREEGIIAFDRIG